MAQLISKEQQYLLQHDETRQKLFGCQGNQGAMHTHLGPQQRIVHITLVVHFVLFWRRQIDAPERGLARGEARADGEESAVRAMRS